MASPASAAEMIIHNTLDNKVQIAILYYDRATDQWTTRGWWDVLGNSDRTLDISNVDTDKGMYYFAKFGKNAYVDKSTIEGEYAHRWVSNDVFRFDFDGKPSSGTKLREELFYKSHYSEGAGGFVVTIDTMPVG